MLCLPTQGDLFRRREVDVEVPRREVERSNFRREENAMSLKYEAKVKNKIVEPRVIKAADMKPGEVGIIIDASNSGWGGTLVLRVFNGLVSLTNPQSTWDCTHKVRPNFDIRLLSEGETVEITPGAAPTSY
jgi:hypothetical protein